MNKELQFQWTRQQNEFTIINSNKQRNNNNENKYTYCCLQSTSILLCK